MITVTALRKRRPGKGEGDIWISHGAVRGGGALWARISRSGVSFYFRHTDSEGRKRALALGGWDEEGTKGITLAQAIERTGELSKLYREGVKDLHAHVERQRAAAEAARQAEDAAARRATQDAEHGTLERLLSSYADHLKKLGKQSASDVENIFELHIPADLKARKARELRPADFVPVIRKLVQAGKGRTGEKLRSYGGAGYALAMRAELDPAAPGAGEGFGIEINPFAAIPSMSQFSRARDRVLDAEELGALLRELDEKPQDTLHDAIRLLLCLGGQRPAQLVRVRRNDVDVPAATITLHDGKGQRRQPRLHVLPLTKEAATIIGRCIASKVESPYLFATEKGKSARAESLSRTFRGIADALVKAEKAREHFELRDIRRTCETMLASLKVSSDIRAQIQSHGLSGVQVKHYDRHSYALEKKQALEKWARHLATLKAGKKADVIEIGGKRGSRSEARP